MSHDVFHEPGWSWRRTARRPFAYWLIGALALFSILPAGLIDIFLAPGWHAPHWQCDSLGIPILEASAAAAPWALISAGLSAALAIPAARRRAAGCDIFRLRLGRGWVNALISAPVILLAGLAFWQVAEHVWRALVVQTFIADCNGRAEPITVSRRGPLLQISPLVLVALALWALHLRALALAPRGETRLADVF